MIRKFLNLFAQRTASGETEYTKLIAVSFMTSTLNSFISAAVAFVTIPLVIASIGQEQYGLFVLMGSFIGLFGFADLGAMKALVNVIGGIRKGSVNYERVGGLMALTATFMGGVAVALFLSLLATIFAGVPIFDLLGIPDNLESLAVIVLIASGLTWAVNALLSGVLRTGFQGFNQVPYYNFLTLLYTIGFGVAYILFLLQGPGLLGIAWFLFGIAIARLLLLFYGFRRMAPSMSWRIGRGSVDGFTRVLRYSPALLVTGVAAALISKSDAIAASVFLGLSGLAVYHVAYRLFQIPSFATRLTDALFPSAVEIHVKQDMETLRALYRRIMRLSVVVRLTLVTVILGYAQHVILLWVGPDFLVGFDVLIALFFLFVVFAWTGPHVELAQALGLYSMLAGRAIIYLVGTVILYLLLVPTIGLAGIPASIGLANLAVNGVGLSWTMHRRVNFQPLTALLDILKRIAIPIAVFWLVWAFIQQWETTPLMMLLVGIPHALVFAYLMFRFGLEKKEREFILGKIYAIHK